jgi:O-antigen ligase
MVDSPADDTTDARRSRPGSALAIFGLLLIVCLGPLPYGSVLVRERTFLQVCAFLALAAVLAGVRRRPLLPAAVPAAMIAAVGAWGVLQSLPLPRFVAELSAPRIADGWDRAAALLAAGPPASEAVLPAWLPLSSAPAVSRATGLHWLAIAAAMAAASRVGADRRARRLIAGGFLAAAAFEVFFGAEKWFAHSGVLWGLEVAGDPGRLRGTFINSDHLAFYLTMASAVVLSWLWWSVRRAFRGAPAEHQLLAALVPGLLFLVFFAGIAFSGSRAGLAVAVLAILACGLLLAAYHRRWAVALAALGVVALGLGGVALLGLQRGVARWAATSAYDVTWSSRFAAYRATWDLWHLSPWTGTGLGTFRQAFPRVQPAELEGTWIHAHSDPLELLATAGPAGPILVVWGLVALCRHLFAAFTAGRRSEDRAAALFGLVAVTGAALHSAVDFALTIPANAFTLAILCGLACGAAPQRRRRSGRADPAG